MIPVGADLVKIWGVEAELFLMIDDQGQMRGTVSTTYFSYIRPYKARQKKMAQNIFLGIKKCI